MKRLILAIASASLLSCGLANAADMAVKSRPLPLPPCAQFGGFYVGGNVGWGYGEHRFRDLDGFGPFAGFFLPNEATRSVGRLRRRYPGRLQLAIPLHGLRHRGRLQLGERRP